MNNKVLIIQTDPMQARRLEHLLFDHGHSSQSTRTAEDAMAIIESKGHPLLVITELALPGQDGFEFLAWLKSRPTSKDCPSVVVSAFPDLLSNALRQKTALGIGAVVSAKASAMQLAKVFEDTLNAASARREKLLRESFRPPATMQADVKAGVQATQAIVQASAEATALAKAEVEAKAREVKRLAKIAALHLDRSLPEAEALQKLATDMTRAFEFSLALISLAQETRQWTMVSHGPPGKLMQEKSKPSDWNFCANLIEADPGFLISVPDAKVHPTFQASPLVLQGLVGSCAGAPILAADGKVLGCLALVDPKPRPLTPELLELLRTLARHLAGELDLSRQVHALKQDLSAQSDLAVRRDDQVDMMREVLAQLHLGVVIHDNQGKILLASHRLNYMTQMGPEMEGRHISEFEKGLINLMDEPGELRERLHGDADGPYSAMEIFETQRPQRQILRWTARPIQLKEGWCQFSTFEDITAEIDLATQQERLALVDPLTSLLNRRGVEEEGARESERARRKQRHYSLLLFQIDGFSAINNNHGYDAGDAVLCAMAAALRGSLRMIDRPSRWSGKSFMVLLPETNEPDAKLVAKRIKEAVAKSAVKPGFSVHCGIATSSSKDPDFKITVEMVSKRLLQALSDKPEKSEKAGKA
jgi:diguanylate cyclase (GGDEF)-like protein